MDDETPLHYFLCCLNYTTLRRTYLSKISEIIGSAVTALPNDHLIQTLMYGSNVVSNKSIINETILFIKTSGRLRKLMPLAEHLFLITFPFLNAYRLAKLIYLLFNYIVFLCNHGVGDRCTVKPQKRIIVCPPLLSFGYLYLFFLIQKI